VEGDRAEASTDSRAFGPVGRSSIRGSVVLVYAPWSTRRKL
jgi:type IV secretory pathway protease TraF